LAGTLKRWIVSVAITTTLHSVIMKKKERRVEVKNRDPLPRGAKMPTQI